MVEIQKTPFFAIGGKKKLQSFWPLNSVHRHVIQPDRSEEPIWSEKGNGGLMIYA